MESVLRSLDDFSSSDSVSGRRGLVLVTLLRAGHARVDAELLLLASAVALSLRRQ